MNQTKTSSQKIISASLFRLRMRSPFFATLALFTKFIPTQNIPTAARYVYYQFNKANLAAGKFNIPPKTKR